ncbi:MAG: hypothetical protein LBJ41_00530 [Treponema sp.]|jgi:hypothetical protein|nr:hypothetical protein [Treponema sp.]
MSFDYLLLTDAEFNRKFKQINLYVEQKCSGSTPVWTHIPASARTEMADTYTAWNVAYTVLEGPHTKVDTEAKNNAKKVSKKRIRAFVNQYLRFPPVTDEDRTAMGIPNRDIHPSPIPRPTGLPIIEVLMPHPRTVRIRFRGENSKRWSKPKNVHGLECLWVLTETPPAEIENLLHSAFTTANPLDISFKESERGKRVYFAVRWETSANLKGDWSEIFNAIVP